jgi:dihydrolipoamide dehydrogenase
MSLEATEEDRFATVFPHPTMSEALHVASLDAYGRVLHI